MKPVIATVVLTAIEEGHMQIINEGPDDILVTEPNGNQHQIPPVGHSCLEEILLGTFQVSSDSKIKAVRRQR